MKRIIPIILTLCLLLSGCMCIDGTMTVNEDGSATSTVFVGMTAEAVNQAIESGAELSFEPTTQLVRNGITYLGEYQTEHYATIEELNDESVTITRGDGSFTLTLNYTAEDKAAAEETYGLDDPAMAMLMDQMYIVITYAFPYTVTQTGGPTSGINVSGNQVSFDSLAMVPGSYSFYAGPVSQFTDVSADAWYYTAVQAMQTGGLVNGYGNGQFGPEDSISLAAICTILARCDGIECGSYIEGGYWAERAIDYCVSSGYIRSHGKTAPEVYDVAATREEVIAAISTAYAGYCTTGSYCSGYDINTIKPSDVEFAKEAMHLLYDNTGYSVYITADPNADIAVLSTQKFGDAKNGVVVKLVKDGEKVVNASCEYYTANGDDAKAHIAALFNLTPDPFKSLVLSDYSHAEGKYDVNATPTIPDVDKIAEEYRQAINTAYVVGLCHGVDADGTFLPKSPIRRSEVCQLFYNINWTTPGVG